MTPSGIDVVQVIGIVEQIVPIYKSVVGQQIDAKAGVGLARQVIAVCKANGVTTLDQVDAVLAAVEPEANSIAALFGK